MITEELKLRLIRMRREGYFKKLDALYLKADEQDDRAEKNKIASVKRELRDVTIAPEVLSATSIEDCNPVAFASYFEYINGTQK